MNAPRLYCSGRYGQLSRYLISRGVNPISDGFTELIEPKNQPTLLATYSATQRHETKEAYDLEINYYSKLISSLRAVSSYVKVVYVSSQTVILDDQSLYAKAKLNIENLFVSSGLPCLLLRPGFIFSEDDRLFISSLSLMASQPFTLGISHPCFSACRASDLLQRAHQFASTPLDGEHECRIEHLGLTLRNFSGILDLQQPFKYRLSIPLPLLRVLAMASPKLRKIIHPVSKTTFPSLGVTSYYDDKARS